VQYRSHKLLAVFVGPGRQNVSSESFPADYPKARPLAPPVVVKYFGILFALAIIAQIPGAIFVGFILFIVPGLMLVASSTVLYYSIALLPAYFVDRSGKRRLAAAVAVFGVAAAALLPHYIGGFLLGRLLASDRSDPSTSFRPRSFELPYPDEREYWINWHQPGSNQSYAQPCADLCQQLLFKGHIGEVVIRELANPHATGAIVIGPGSAIQLSRSGAKILPPVRPAPDFAKLFAPKVWRFRLQKRQVCPETFSRIEGEFVHAVDGGLCLVEDTVESADPDVVLTIDRYDDDGHEDLGTVPTTVSIAERRDHHAVPVEIKTSLIAHYPSIPFYFALVGEGVTDLAVVPTVAMEPFPKSFADPYEMLSRRYRLPLSRPACGFAVTPTTDPWARALCH
jgi:hypothetical protein